MKIKDSKILVLGGSGLVGRTIVKFLLNKKPKLIIINALTKEETDKVASLLKSQLKTAKIIMEPGDIFSFGSTHNTQEDNYEDFLEPLSAEILKKSRLYKLISKYQPEIIVDTVNTATVIAYQNLYVKALELSAAVKKPGEDGVKSQAQVILSSLYLPKLVRHIQILYEALRNDQNMLGSRGRVKVYLKVGTTGTGGMGLNIPYTHGEEKPSRMLLSKTALAGAHSLLLYTISQTPNTPKIVEIKPATSIAWGEIGAGVIKNKGKNIELQDFIKPIDLRRGKIVLRGKQTGRSLRSVFLDSGENGVFASEEFRSLTNPSQMGFVTPEEIANLAVKEIEGEETEKNILKSLQKTVLGPSNKAYAKREDAFLKLKKLSTKEFQSPALGFLGPPRLSKLLFEGRLLKETFPSFNKFLSVGTKKACNKLASKVSSDTTTRTYALTIGVPVLFPDGVSLISADYIKIPADIEKETITETKINIWANQGWIDLREINIKLWQKRIKEFKRKYNKNPEHEGDLASFIFETEDKGYRIKRQFPFSKSLTN